MSCFGIIVPYFENKLPNPNILRNVNNVIKMTYTDNISYTINVIKMTYTDIIVIYWTWAICHIVDRLSLRAESCQIGYPGHLYIVKS